MLDKIPDNTFKIIFAISIVVFYFLFVKISENLAQRDQDVLELKTLKDTLVNNYEYLNFEKEKLFRQAEYLSIKYNVDSLILMKDTSYVVNVKKNRNINYKEALQEIFPYYDRYALRVHNHQILAAKYNDWHKLYDIKEKGVRTLWPFIVMAMLTSLPFAFSLWSLRTNEIQKEKRELYIEAEKGEIKSCCQSCGRDFDSFISYSKNADGTLNFSFCRECVVNGVFVLSYEDVEKLIVSNKHIPEDKREDYFLFINRLDRWNSNKYRIL